MVYTQEAMDAVLTGNMRAMDPENLFISAYNQWENIEMAEKPRDWEQQLAACRAWVDANEWGKSWCCFSRTPEGETPAFTDAP